MTETRNYVEEGIMETTNVSVRPRVLGLISAVLGILGIAFWWYVPMGMVIGLTGLVLGLIGWFLTPRGASRGFVITGLVLSLAALVLDFIVLGQGLETYTFSPLR
jgi:hypothetical protein